MQLLDQTWADLRFGARNLARNPSFAVIAVLSMALGIGATAAMYSVIQGVILDPFPYKDVDRLMSIMVYSPAGRGGRLYYNVDQFIEFRERSTIFTGVVASTISDVTWTGGAEPRRLRGNHITSDTFDVMGVPPLLGRTTSKADDDPAAEPVAVLGYKCWVRDFGADPTVLGRKLRLNDRVRTVIGVMPPRFMWRGADVYIPIVFRRGEAPEGVRAVHVLGRLKPGVTPAQAEADLRPIVTDLKQRDTSAIPDNWRVKLLSFKETFPSDIRQELWILFGAVGLLLLISCVNVSNLLFTRASTRAAEISIRASLGATRFRIVRQLLSESVLIAIAGGACGILLAAAGLRGILAMVPPNTIPDEAEIVINIPVLLFAVGISVASALIAGLAPALHVARSSDGAAMVTRGTRGVAGSRVQKMLRGTLVAAEVALSLMLLVGASLLFRTLIQVQGVNLGFRPERTLTLRIPVNEARYRDPEVRRARLQQIVDQLKTAPGIRAVGVNTWFHPIGNWGIPVTVDGVQKVDARSVLLHQVNEQYCAALGIQVISGRMLSESEVLRRAKFAVVNQAFVRAYIPDGNAIGRLIRGARPERLPPPLRHVAFEIIGVVEDRVNDIGEQQVMPEFYVPHTILGQSDYLIVAGDLPADSLAAIVRPQVYAVDRDQPVMDVKGMDRVLQEFVYSRPRFNLLLLSVFAAFGLALAICGIYGVLSHAVAQQTQEIGLRVALGATSAQLLGMVLMSGLRVLAIGAAAGLLGSFVAFRLLSSNVTGVKTPDGMTVVGVTALLIAVGLLACLVPAMRATRIDPATALRNE